MEKDLSWLINDTWYMDLITSYAEKMGRRFDSFMDDIEEKFPYLNDLFVLVDNYAKANDIKLRRVFSYFGDYFYYLEYNGKFYEVGAYAEKDSEGNVKKSNRYYLKKTSNDVTSLAIKYDDIRNNIKTEKKASVRRLSNFRREKILTRHRIFK